MNYISWYQIYFFNTFWEIIDWNWISIFLTCTVHSKSGSENKNWVGKKSSVGEKKTNSIYMLLCNVLHSEASCEVVTWLGILLLTNLPIQNHLLRRHHHHLLPEQVWRTIWGERGGVVNGKAREHALFFFTDKAQMLEILQHTIQFMSKKKNMPKQFGKTKIWIWRLKFHLLWYKTMKRQTNKKSRLVILLKIWSKEKHAQKWHSGMGMKQNFW